MEKQWNDGRRFAGRVAVVTGAGGALGGAVARALGREGARVALGYRTSRDSAQANVEEIEGNGGEAFAAMLDVTEERSVQDFVAGVVERYGDIEVLVNAAGRIDPKDYVRFEHIDTRELAQLLNVDVLGTVRMCKAVREHMLAAGRGAIVNFSGSYGNGVDQENLINSVAVGYCTAKGAIRALTASLARDLAPVIRVNAISPGAIEANWEADWDVDPTQLEQALEMTPLRRMGVPEEIAETTLFLASDGGGYITGQVLQVDGGWLMTG
ncbi:MAG TPA: SDR family oxidoreductase [Solirubrobacteraceae bacterium]|jgi:3-oxoacyl-[acyl-carrier protein] reductase|nr:SDR family oxidoreductase [Solirubrobacteraceae bacterium]